jgi:hypothetical protein
MQLRGGEAVHKSDLAVRKDIETFVALVPSFVPVMTIRTTMRPRTKRYRSDFLFSKGSILMGMGNVLTIGGRYHLFNYSPSEEEADRRALEADLGIIGQELERAFLSMPAKCPTPTK